jgi:hypothetical protein
VTCPTSSWRLGLLLVLVGGASVSGEVQAQDLREATTTCGRGSEVVLALCQETILAVQAAQGAFGLAAAGGTDLPGSASTLGWRLPQSPRFALSLRGSVTRISMPDLGGGSILSGGDQRFSLFSGEVTGTLGIFDGFSPAPTVGGMLSLDLSTSGHWVSAPQDQGFQGGVMGWGVGARVGILRESFSLPGVSFSAFRRWLGNTGIGDVEGGDSAHSYFDIDVSSFRGVIGKDLWGVGFVGGVGWDRNGGDATLWIPDPGGGLPGDTGASVTSVDMSFKRRLFFVGASRTFLALQLSTEVGWAEGFDPELLPGGGGGFEPDSPSYFGSLAFRFTL